MVAQPAASGTLIVLGGAASDLFATGSHRLVERSGRVVVVDPASPVALPHGARAEHVWAAASSQDGDVEMTVYSVHGLRSFLPPAPALKNLFPGLQELSKETVPALSVASLLERLQPLDGPVRLWIDMPGEEALLLENLRSAGLLERVEELVIRCGVEPFFAGSEDCDAIRKRLTQEMFDLVETDERDPDWPVLWFRDSPMLRRLAELESDFAEARSQNAAQQAALAEKDTALEETRAQNTTLRVALAEKDAALAARDTSLATAKDDLETALKNHQKREESLNSRLLAQRGAEQELSEQMRRTEVNYRSARRDLTLALEQQNRLRLDYEALQQQYAQLHDEKAELEMLLQQLTPRLREASQYLRDMRAKTADQEEAEELSASEGDAAVPLQGAGKKNRKKSPA
jgi:flagellar biosynthesis GTPase FlhF